MYVTEVALLDMITYFFVVSGESPVKSFVAERHFLSNVYRGKAFLNAYTPWYTYICICIFGNIEKKTSNLFSFHRLLNFTVR